MFLDELQLQETKTRSRTRITILKSAFELFCTKGIGKISMVEISKSAEITRRTLYNYYDEKEQIAVEIYNHMTGHILNQLSEKSSVITENIGRDALKEYITALYEIITENPRILFYLVRFDQFAYEHQDVIDPADQLDRMLEDEGTLKKIVQILREKAILPGYVEDLDMAVRVTIQSVIGYIERVTFRIRSLQMEGSLKDDQFYEFLEFMIPNTVALESK